MELAKLKNKDQVPFAAAPLNDKQVPHSDPGRYRPRRITRIVSSRLTITLVSLIILIIGAAFLGQRFLGTPATAVNSIQTAPKPDKARWLPPPYTDQQINELHHLADYFRYQQLASLDVSRMTLDQEIGQVIMVGYQAPSYSTELDTMIHGLYAGGVILYQRQINTYAQTRQDIAHMQSRANFPLLISADEEGWNVHRLTNIYPPRLSASDIGASGNTAVATKEGQRVAHDLLSLGFNTNFAPDVDVSSVNDYIGYDARSFGSTAQNVIKYVGPYTKAMQSNGVIATMKHFPGLGSAPRATDPHAVFVTIPHTRQQVYTIDLAPFNYFIHASAKDEQPGIIMATDELVPSIDPTYIAELSYTFITKILRQQMGYDGVVITDDLTMGGVQVNGQHLTLAQAAVLALQAGNDMLLGPSDVPSMQTMINAIKVALNNGTLSKTRLDEAARRILTLKIEHHLIPAIPPQS
ncbi:glycoside hydrolase family 3 [Ktedonobacteria bacterium brp13]|nr:glycoside hydrolase family 3 [Ktedonobacteria bacterium brp13]